MPNQRAFVFPKRSQPACSWKLARLEARDAVPAEADWFPASVPGAVQLDWAKARGLPDYAYGSNVLLYAGLEDYHWLYRTEVPRIALARGERLFFFCGGVDYQCEVRLSGVLVHAQIGMLAGFDIDVSAAPPGALLEILIFPAPKRHALPADRSQASHVTKAAVSYGWDWQPRLIPLGLCESTGFEVRLAPHLRSVDFAYVLSDDLSAADISVSVESSEPASPFKWTLSDEAGNRMLESALPTARFERPRLWWTHDHGTPFLYILEVTLPEGDVLRRRVGFRRVRLVMHPGAWEGDVVFPKSRENPPITFELNGRQIFLKGSNWVGPDIFYGRVDGETYRPLLELARGVHFNLLRCWGGAPAPKEEFFEQCDALGLLVWQEFPLACNCYPDDPGYLDLLDRESRSLLRRVRQHACLGLWVGGNELFNSWSRMTDQSLPLRLLNKNCYELDLHTPFLPTAPVEGMGHGDYRFQHNGRDVFDLFQNARCTAYSEFGCSSVSPVEYLKTFIPPGELWPARPGTSWEVHHGLGAWEADATTWLCATTLEHFFGPLGTLEDAVAKSSWLQCEGYKSIFEEARRQKPRCSMALNWCFNEPWPTAANNSIVNYPARPKPAYYSVQDACRPVLASARIPRFQWREGEDFSAELWILNDGPGAQLAGKLKAELVAGGKRVALGEWAFPVAAPFQNVKGPTVRVVLPDSADGAFLLELSVASNASWSSSYRLSLRSKDLPRLPETAP